MGSVSAWPHEWVAPRGQGDPHVVLGVLLCFISTDAGNIGYRGFPQGSPHPNCAEPEALSDVCLVFIIHPIPSVGGRRC